MSYFTENASPVDSGAYAYKEKYGICTMHDDGRVPPPH